MNRYFENKNLPVILLSLGLAFVFVYAGAASLMHPLEWIGYIPGFVGKLVNPDAALKGIAIFEILLGIWLVIGKYRKIAAALSVLLLAGIILADRKEFIITFRDVGLLLAALALFFTPE